MFTAPVQLHMALGHSQLIFAPNACARVHMGISRMYSMSVHSNVPKHSSIRALCHTHRAPSMSTYRHAHSSTMQIPKRATLPARSAVQIAPSQQTRYYSSTFLGMSGSASIMSLYWIFLGINTVPFATIQYAKWSNNIRLQDWWARNMLVSLDAIDQGRWWTTLTSAVSHQEISHFAFNMFTAHTMCQILSIVPALNGGHVALTMLGSAVCGSLGYIVNQKSKLKSALNGGDRAAAYSAFNVPALGASGAIMGLAATATCFTPFMPISIMFIPISFPLWIATAGYLVVDTWGLQSSGSRTAHAGHLGGLAFGIFYYLVSLKSLAPFGVWAILRSWF